MKIITNWQTDELRHQWSAKNNCIDDCGIGGKVCWVCEEGHEWSASPADRLRGRGCPYCVGKKASPSYNLEKIVPWLVREWNQGKNGSLRPVDVLPHSIRKVWWTCKKGHEWAAAIGNRTKGSGCPYCSGFRANDRNNLATRPDLVLELHPEKSKYINPRLITKGSSKKLWWKCINGHEWEGSPKRRVGGVGCPYCHKKYSDLEIRIWAEVDSLFGAIWSPKLGGVEVDVMIPSLNVAIETDGYYWHKDRFEQDVIKRTFLSNRGIRLIRAREKPLALTSSDDISYMGKEPQFTVVKKIIVKVGEVAHVSVAEYLCNGEFQSDAKYKSMVSSLRFPRKSAMDVAPILESEWNTQKNGDLSLRNFSFASNKTAWWICQEGHEWEDKIVDRVLKNAKCPQCKLLRRLQKLASKERSIVTPPTTSLPR